MIDNTQAPNTAHAGISKSLSQEIGVGRGDITTPNSSLFIIKRDPFRAVRRGRQLFQRKLSLESRDRAPAWTTAWVTLLRPSSSAQAWWIAVAAVTHVRG